MPVGPLAVLQAGREPADPGPALACGAEPQDVVEHVGAAIQRQLARVLKDDPPRFLPAGFGLRGDVDSGHTIEQLLLGWHGGRRREEEVQPAVRGDERRVLQSGGVDRIGEKDRLKVLGRVQHGRVDIVGRRPLTASGGSIKPPCWKQTGMASDATCPGSDCEENERRQDRTTSSEDRDNGYGSRTHHRSA
jgi:hypothetical protein